MEEEKGSIPLGSPATKIVSSLKQPGSTLPTRSPASETTGPQKQGPGPQSSTGRQLGAIGAAVPKMTDRLDAAEVGRVLQASLPPGLSSSLRETVNSDFDLIGYDVVKPIDKAEAQAVIAVMDAIEIYDPTPVVKAATICLSVTTAREREFADVKMMMAALVDGTREFPADIAVSAFRRWQKSERWWPTLAEIRQFCNEEHRWRKSLRRTLEAVS